MSAIRRRWTVFALLLVLFMAAVEMTVVSTGMPTVVGDLGGIDLYPWVFSAYMLAATVTMPLFGKLGDLYGRKAILLLGLALFAGGSASCGLARSMHVLIACRAIQGLGAGAMHPMTFTIIGDLYNLEERARMQGVFGAVWGFAGIVGPLLGGVIIERLSWPWLFLVNLPFGVIAVAVIALALRESVARREHPLDFAGAGWLALGTVALLASAGGAPWAEVSLPVAAGAVVLFVRAERRAREPILPLDLMGRRVIAVANGLGAMLGALMMSTVTYLPLYAQAVRGGTAAEAGAAITPMVLGWPISSAFAGRLIPRHGFRAIIRIGLAVIAAAGIALAFSVRPGAPPWLTPVAAGALGVGMGFANTALLIAVQTSVEWGQRGVVTAGNMFFRTMGGTISVGALGGLLVAALTADPTIRPEDAHVLLRPGNAALLSPAAFASLAHALEAALGQVFVLLAVLAAATVVVGRAFPRNATPPAEPADRTAVVEPRAAR